MFRFLSGFNDGGRASCHGSQESDPPERDLKDRVERREDDGRFSQSLAAMPRNSGPARHGLSHGAPGPGVFTSILAKLARERRWWDVDAVFEEMAARMIKRLGVVWRLNSLAFSGFEHP